MLTIKVTAQKGNAFEMSMIENENILAKGSIVLDEPAELLSFDNNPNIVKALLNLADNKGLQKVICRNNESADMLVNIGFTRNDNVLFIDLDAFFASKCKNI